MAVGTVLVVSMLVHSQLMPFKKPYENYIEILSLMLVLAAFLATDSPDIGEYEALQWALSVLSLLMMIALFCVVVYTSYQSLLYRAGRRIIAWYHKIVNS